jgi:hypothetical protein
MSTEVDRDDCNCKNCQNLLKNGMKAPKNTEQEAKENPQRFLISSIVKGSSTAIEDQEAEGQKSFVGSETLPTKMGQGLHGDDKAILESWGITFLGPVEGDKLFTYVELPKGWNKVPTDHSMWSNLVDDKGRVRANIFYKAAFYDRDAFLNVCPRFTTQRDYDKKEKENVIVVNVMDCGKIIHSTEPMKLPERGQAYLDMLDDAEAKAQKWLDEHYPNWKDKAACW